MQSCPVSKAKDPWKRTRVLYILEAAFEYFINILLGGVYIAKLATSIGMDTAMAGVVSSFISLGLSFQLISIFLANKRPVKRWVTILHTINQLAFGCVYLVPLFKMTRTMKTIIFIVLLLIGQVINNMVNSPKINWLMGAVDDDKRGAFTATKEIVSLIGSLVFTYVVGVVIDTFEAAGNLNGAFLCCGFGIFGLTLLHTLTLLGSKERPAVEAEKQPTGQLIKSLSKDKNLWKLVICFSLFGIVQYATTPFYGTYQTEELGFTMEYVMVLAVLYSLVRASIAPFMGRIGDKYSFVTLLNICVTAFLISFAINVFTVPENGKLFFTMHYIMYAVGWAGYDNCVINLIYEMIPRERRVGAFALKNAFAGLCGFFSTLVMSTFVKRIQANGNMFLGIHAYAQQVVTAFGVIGIIVLLVYINTVIRKMQKQQEKSE